MKIFAPENCATMPEIRAGIDATDRELVTLLARRMRCIEAAVRIKTDRAKVHDEARKADAIAKVTVAAEANGISREHVAAVYELLVERSIAHEFDVFDALRGDVRAVAAAC